MSKGVDERPSARRLIAAALIGALALLVKPVFAVFPIAGALLALRFVYEYFTDVTFGGRMVQSLIFSAVFMIIGFQVLLMGLLADVISANRKLLEDLLYRVRKIELRDGRDVD